MRELLASIAATGAPALESLPIKQRCDTYRQIVVTLGGELLAIRTTLPFIATDPKNCLELARIPEQIRGFGRVKEAAIKEARERQRSLLRGITGKDLPPAGSADPLALDRFLENA